MPPEGKSKKKIHPLILDDNPANLMVNTDFFSTSINHQKLMVNTKQAVAQPKLEDVIPGDILELDFTDIFPDDVESFF